MNLSSVKKGSLPQISRTGKSSLRLQSYESPNMGSLPDSTQNSSSQNKIVAAGRGVSNLTKLMVSGHATAHPRQTTAIAREAYTDIDSNLQLQKQQKQVMHESSRGRFPQPLAAFANQAQNAGEQLTSSQERLFVSTTDRMGGHPSSTISLKLNDSRNAKNNQYYETPSDSQNQIHQTSTILRPATTQLSSSQTSQKQVPSQFQPQQQIIQPFVSRNNVAKSVSNTQKENSSKHENSSGMIMARRTAYAGKIHNTKQRDISQPTGAYSMVSSSVKQMRPMTQNQRGAAVPLNYNSVLGNEVIQLTQTNENMTNTSLYFSQKDRVMQRPVDQHESLDSVNMQFQHVEGGSVADSERGQIKLVITRSELQKQKMMRSHYLRLANTSTTIQKSAEGKVPDIGSMTPQQIAQMRDKHLLETSIQDQPKTGKSGIFERERSPEEALVTLDQRTLQELSLVENVNQSDQMTDRVQFQMPDIKRGLKSRSMLQSSIQTQQNSIMQPQKLLKNQPSQPEERYLHSLNPKPFLSQMKGKDHKSQSPFRRSINNAQSQREITSLYLQTNEQRSQNLKVIDSMHTDLTKLINLEPYAHRTKLLKQAQQNQSQSMDQILETSQTMSLNQLENQVDFKAKEAPKLSNRQIEDWLNQTLEFQLQESYEEQNRILNRLQKGSRKEESSTQLAPVPQNKQQKTPLISLEIDRIAMDEAGIDQAEVDRLYRGLYAGSVGVFDTIKTCLMTVKTEEKYKVMGRLWNAFQMLLQHCCPSDFQMIGRKLIEDQIKEINKVKTEFGKYKTEMLASIATTEKEFQECKKLLNEVSEEKVLEFNRRQEADFKNFELQASYEEEIRLRLDFELKINKLHNLNVALRNHEATLNRKIEELEQNQSEYKHRCQIQEEEIVTLRSWKLQQQMVKQLDDVKIETVQKNELDTKEKLITVTMSMQNKEQEIAKKTNLNMALQSVVNNKDSKIRALTDQVVTSQKKDAEINAQYEQYSKQIQAQERSIQEYMTGLNEQDAQLVSVQRQANEKEFNAFEFQMAQSRVRDLEAHMDKLLESTTDQRQVIENFTEEINSLKRNIEHLRSKDERSQKSIKILQTDVLRILKELKAMTRERDDYKSEKEILDKTLEQKLMTLKQYEITNYQLEQQVESLTRQEESQLASISQLQEKFSQAKQSASTWESKFHKLQIQKEKSDKLAKDSITKLEQYEKNQEKVEAQHSIDKEVLQERLKHSQSETDDFKKRLWADQHRLMRRSIRLWIVKLLFRQLHLHFNLSKKSWDLSKSELRESSALKESDLLQNLKTKERLIEHLCIELEDRAAQSLALQESETMLLKASSLRGEELDQTKTRNEGLINEVKEFNETVKDLKAQLEEIKSKNTDLQNTNEKCKQTIESQRERLSAKEASISELELSIARSQAEINRVQTLHSIKQKVHEATQTNEEIGEILNKVNASKRRGTIKDSKKQLTQLMLNQNRRMTIKPSLSNTNSYSVGSQKASKRSSGVNSKMSGNLTPDLQLQNAAKASSLSPSAAKQLSKNTPQVRSSGRQLEQQQQSNSNDRERDAYNQLVQSPMYANKKDARLPTDSEISNQKEKESEEVQINLSRQQTLSNNEQSESFRSTRRVVLQQLSQPQSRNDSGKKAASGVESPQIIMESRAKPQPKKLQTKQIKGLLKSAMNRHY